MVSMKDVAAKCGVSVASVSKALNGHSDISEETRERVRRVADELGYHPNSIARALKTNRSYNIGVLMNDGFAHEYYAEVLESFKNEAESKGYDITFINRHNKKMSILEYCIYRRFDGVLLACGENFNDPEIFELVNGKIPVVTIDFIFNGRTAVKSNNVRGMSELVRYAYSRGHRKIAYIYGNPDSDVTRERLASFYKTMEECGLDVPSEYVKPSVYLDSERAEKLTYELLKHKDPPTCILYPDDLSVVGGRNAVKSLKLKTPKDVSVAGYDGTKFSQMLSPKITTVRQNTNEVGKRAADELINVIEKPKTAIVKTIVVDGELIEGETIRKL
ncbi:MAG: LacI family DNA-binding transcriptional regulator [Lachnospira sp.]